MSIENFVKNTAWRILRAVRRLAGLETGSHSIRSDALELWQFVFNYSKAQRLLRRGQRKDYSDLVLAPESEALRVELREKARTVHGGEFEYLSLATNREVVHAFQTVTDRLASRFDTVNYLEIGSAQGLSMSLMGLMLAQKGCLGRLVSVDPYFEEGYVEGGRGPWGRTVVSQATEGMMQRALRLYESVDLPVELKRTTSLDGLSELVAARERFELIYVDGYHEGLTPAVDTGLSLALLRDGGVVMLDDHQWPDVKPLRELLTLHAEPIVTNWKIAAFSVDLHSTVQATTARAAIAR